MTMMAAFASCTLLGLQHGIDWDHVAAISDVTSVQTTRAKATRCGFLYAVGHAATIGVLGITVIVLGHSVPQSVSGWMQKVVGLTLLLLGAYVVSTFFSSRGRVSRGQAILNLLGRLHTHNGKIPDPLNDQRYGSKSALSLGVLHGIGAETPTQLSMLAIAMNMGGLRGGILGLLVFALSMFVSNMALTAVATSVFALSKLRPALFRWLAAMTAGYSLWIGAVLVAS